MFQKILGALLAVLERGFTIKGDGYEYGFSVGPEVLKPLVVPTAKVAPKANIGKSQRSSELRKLRSRAGLSQAKFAARVGCSGPHISNSENGKCQPSLALLRKAREITKIQTSSTAATTVAA